MAIVLLAALTLFRIAFAVSLDLIPDESYYWLWSKHLDASYFSKGPAVAWTIAAGTFLFGDTVLGVRWFSILLAAGTGWQLFVLGRRLLGARAGLIALCLAVITPLYAIGGILMTIDPLSVFFWVWAANLFLDALDRPELWRWALCGLAIGGGFLSKYVNLLELLSFGGFLAWTPRHRHLFRSRQMGALLAAVLLSLMPVLWWNQHHGWVTAAHLQHRGDLDGGFHVRPGELFKFIIAQAAAMSPLLWIALLVAVWKTARRQKTEGELFLVALFLPCFLFYALLSVNKAAEGNWTAVSYPAAFILAAAYWPLLAAFRRSARWFWRAAIALAIVETVLFHHTAWVHLPPKKDLLLRAQGWQDYAAQFESLRREAQQAAGVSAPPLFLLANNYGTASELAFYLPGHPTLYLPHTEHVENQFSIWPGYAVKKGSSALYLTDDPSPVLPPVLAKEFGKAARWGNFWRKSQAGENVTRYYVWKLGPAPKDVR